MAGARIPGPLGTGSNTPAIDAGTLNRRTTPPPGPIGQAESHFSKRVQAQVLVDEYEKNQQNAAAYTLVGEILLESGVGGDYVSRIKKEVTDLYPPGDRSSTKASAIYDKAVHLLQTAEKLLGTRNKAIDQMGATALAAEFYTKSATLSIKNDYIAHEIIQLDPYVASSNHIPGADAPLHSRFGGGGAGGTW